MSNQKEILDDVFGPLAKPRLYSKSVVLWFSFLFSPLVGGLLMLINLNRIQKLSLGITIFLASIVFTLGSIYFGYLIPYQNTSRLMLLIMNLVGANLLSGPVWRNAIGKLDYERINPWLTFAIIVICYAALGIALYALLIRSVSEGL